MNFFLSAGSTSSLVSQLKEVCKDEDEEESDKGAVTMVDMLTRLSVFQESCIKQL